MSSELLPPNSTQTERDITDAASRIGDVPADIGTLIDPQTCPARFLPWLAWAFSVDEWNQEWTEQQKRDVIANSFAVHQKKGTIGAVKTAVAALGYPSRVVEWFQAPTRLDAYEFEAEITNDQGELPSDIFASIKKVIDSAKNARSQLKQARVINQQTGTTWIGSVNYVGNLTEIYPEGSSFDTLRRATLIANFKQQVFEYEG